MLVYLLSFRNFVLLFYFYIKHFNFSLAFAKIIVVYIVHCINHLLYNMFLVDYSNYKEK